MRKMRIFGGACASNLFLWNLKRAKCTTDRLKMIIMGLNSIVFSNLASIRRFFDVEDMSCRHRVTVNVPIIASPLLL